MPTKLDELRQMGVVQRPARRTDIELLLAADAHSIRGIRAALEQGANIDARHPDTGVSALHIAIGNNDLVLCRFLIEECKAGFFADKFGRWPTLVAAECQVDDELGDYIAEQEEKFLQDNPS